MKKRTLQQVLIEYQELKMSFKDLLAVIGKRHVATIERANEALELGGTR